MSKIDMTKPVSISLHFHIQLDAPTQDFYGYDIQALWEPIGNSILTWNVRYEHQHMVVIHLNENQA